MRDDPVAGARVQVFFADSKIKSQFFRTDETGRFQMPVPPAPAYIGVFDEEKTLGVVAYVEAGEKEVVLEMKPTARIRGNLLDGQTGEPIVGKEIQAIVQIAYSDTSFSPVFVVSSKTGAEGRFEIDGLAVGAIYKTQLVTQYHAQGFPSAFLWIEAIKAAHPGLNEIGTLRTPINRRQTFDERIVSAFEYGSPEERWKEMRELAAIEQQHILVFVASPDSRITRQFFRMSYPERGQKRTSPKSLKDYAIFAVDPKVSFDFLEEHGISQPSNADDMALTIMNADGEVLDRTTAVQSTDEARIDVESLDRFLLKHKIEFGSAKDRFADARNLAAEQGKQIIIKFSSPGYPACVRFSRYLNAHQELIEQDYVLLGMDLRMDGAKELWDQFFGDYSPLEVGGVPWTLIVDAEGKVQIDCVSATGNIGFPSDMPGNLHWRKMLVETRSRLTDQEIERLVSAIGTKE